MRGDRARRLRLLSNCVFVAGALATCGAILLSSAWDLFPNWLSAVLAISTGVGGYLLRVRGNEHSIRARAASVEERSDTRPLL